MASKKTEHQRHRKKENFLRQFRDENSKELKQLTAAQFMEIWSHYDTDGKRNGSDHPLCMRVSRQWLHRRA